MAPSIFRGPLKGTIILTTTHMKQSEPPANLRPAVESAGGPASGGWGGLRVDRSGRASK